MAGPAPASANVALFLSRRLLPAVFQATSASRIAWSRALGAAEPASSSLSSGVSSKDFRSSVAAPFIAETTDARACLLFLASPALSSWTRWVEPQDQLSSAAPQPLA